MSSTWEYVQRIFADNATAAAEKFAATHWPESRLPVGWIDGEAGTFRVRDGVRVYRVQMDRGGSWVIQVEVNTP